MKRSRPSADRRSVLLRPVVIAPIAVLLVALAVLLWQRQQQLGALQQEREQFLALVVSATSRAEPDSAELSRLTADLAKYADRDLAPDLLAAGARIELARNRPERAHALFGSRAAHPAATAEEQGLGAEILLRHQAAGVRDVSTATGMLRQAQAFAERAFRASDDSLDLLRAWQAASRLGDKEATARHAELLQQAVPGSPAARLGQLAVEFDVESTPLATVEALRAEFVVPPPELEAMRVLLVLQSGDVRGASLAAEALLLRAPGVLVVRLAVAMVFHACVLREPEQSGTRAQWVERRNHQLDWLLAWSPADDGRRAQWDMLRTLR